MDKASTISVSGYITAREAAKQTKYEYSHFTRKLKKGEIPGAIKFGNNWLVPEKIKREEIHNRDVRIYTNRGG